jgi:uncharacterized protein YjbI with pentapeptide repeats
MKSIFQTKRLTQQQLTDLVPQNCTFGIGTSGKIALLVLSLLLASFLGLIAGLLGGKILTDIIFDFQGMRYLSLGFLTVILLSVTRLRRHEILVILYQATLGSFFWVPFLSLFLLAIGWLENPGEKILGGILINTLDAGFAILSAVLFAILSQVWEQVLSKRHFILNSIFLVLIVTVSTLAAIQLSQLGALDNDTLLDLRQKIDPPNGSIETAVMGGVLWTVLIAIGGIGLSDSMTRLQPRFLWLRQVCIEIAAWGGTSFYHLDLSHLNFSRADVANCDLRAKKLYRTCFQGVVGLERARVDNHCLDLAYPKVQRLLTHGSSPDPDFHRFNLQGAYLQNADMRRFDLTDTILTGADLKGADLRGSLLIRTQLAEADLEGVDLRSNILIDANLTEANLREADLRDCILVRSQVARADFTGAEMTGICIEDWSISSKTNFMAVRCDYVFRQYENGQPTYRYPIDRDFEPGEFAVLFQQPENEFELVFKGDFDYTALSLTFDKLQRDKPDLGLTLHGIEQRGELWVVEIVSDDPARVENHIQEIQDAVYQGYEVTATRLENNPLIRRIISDVANIRKSQEETVEEMKQLAQRIGSNFYFLGGTISNVTGAGEITYTEASHQVRNLFTYGQQAPHLANALLHQLQTSNVATNAHEQAELIQFVILEEAQRDPNFKQFLLQQKHQILFALPEGVIASAVKSAVSHLNNKDQK